MKIVCLGDSLTYGYGIHPYDPAKAWPALIAGKSRVVNAGDPGMALLSGNGYWNSSEYLHAMKSHPDAVIFWLGENDSAEENWNEKRFMKGYSLMVEELLEHVLRDHLLLIQPLFPQTDRKKKIYDFGVRVEPLEKIHGIIQNASETFGVSCFDPNGCLENHRQCFSDDVHPDAEGNRLLAEAVLSVIRQMKWNI